MFTNQLILLQILECTHEPIQNFLKLINQPANNLNMHVCLKQKLDKMFDPILVLTFTLRQH